MSDYKYVSTKPLEEFEVVKKARTIGDLISRQGAINLLKNWSDGCTYIDIETESAIEDFRHLPSAERKGKWIWKGEEGDSRYMCSVCCSKEYVPTCNGEPTIWEFCPNCGARMVNEDDIEAQRDCEAAVEQMEHDILYEPTYSQEDGSM